MSVESVNAARGLNSFLTDRKQLSYGAGRLFGGAALAALIPDPLDVEDLSWLPGITDSRHAADLGRTQGITIQQQVGKLDLTTADDGERPADRGITHHTWMVETSLADAGIERLAEAVQGIEVEYHSNGYIRRAMGTDRTYQRDSDIYLPLLFRLYRNGVLSTFPMDNVLMFLAAPNTEDAGLSYMSGEQRVNPVQFMLYKSLAHAWTDDAGNQVPLHWTTFGYPEGSESESESAS